MTESHPIPKSAVTAKNLLQQQFQRAMNDIAQQAVEDRGLDPAGGWNVNFDTGQITREIADPKE